MSAKKAASKGGPNVKPLGDRILVKPIEETAEKVGNLYIPDSAKEKPLEGTVVVLGSGKKNESGEPIPFDLSVGDRVLYGKYSGDRDQG